MSAREQPARGLKIGVIGGIVMIFVSAVGMIEAFSTLNLVGENFTLARLLMATIPFLAAYIAVRPQLRAGEYVSMAPAAAVTTGAWSGAVVGVVTVLFIALVEAIGLDSVRGIFVNISQPLIDQLTFDQGLAVGSIILILGAAVLGLAGGSVRFLPDIARKPLIVGLGATLVFAMLQRLIPTVLISLGERFGAGEFGAEFLYSKRTGGLTIGGAVLIFAVSAALTWAWFRWRTEVSRRVSRLPREGRQWLRVLAALALLALLFVLPSLIGSVLSNILGRVGIFVLLGLGLNIVVGYAGLLDLGYVAFFAVGAYFLALVTGANLVTSLGETANPSFHLSLNFYMGIPVVLLFAAFVGLMIGAPVLRLRGDYLAIVTLGFGEIARILVQSKALQSFVGGAQGLRDVTDASFFGFTFRGGDVGPQHFYYLVLAIVAVAVFVSYRLADSRTGRAWMAMREDEQVAEATGVSSTKYKLLAFAMGGAVGSLGGMLFAVQVGTTQPDSFVIFVSITALAVIILGGMGSIPGVIVGALVLVGVPELLRQFEEFRLLIYGAVLVGVMILKPEGLIPNVRRMRELHEEERAQDAWIRARAAEEGEEAAAVVGGDRGGE